MREQHGGIRRECVCMNVGMEVCARVEKDLPRAQMKTIKTILITAEDQEGGQGGMQLGTRNHAFWRQHSGNSVVAVASQISTRPAPDGTTRLPAPPRTASLTALFSVSGAR